jgi:hypothetical protein
MQDDLAKRLQYGTELRFFVHNRGVGGVFGNGAIFFLSEYMKC